MQRGEDQHNLDAFWDEAFDAEMIGMPAEDPLGQTQVFTPLGNAQAFDPILSDGLYRLEERPSRATRLESYFEEFEKERPWESKRLLGKDERSQSFLSKKRDWFSAATLDEEERLIHSELKEEELLENSRDHSNGVLRKFRGGFLPRQDRSHEAQSQQAQSPSLKRQDSALHPEHRSHNDANVNASARYERESEEAQETEQKTSKALIQGSMILIVGLILSKLTGQIREIIYGNVFQLRELTDAYVRAFLIPDFIYDLLIGGSIQAAIIPTIAGALGTNQQKRAWRSVSLFISLMTVGMTALVLIGELFAPLILSGFAPPDQLALTAKMARVLFPQTVFMMLAALSIGIVNAHKKFLKTSFGPTIYNSCIIASLLIFGGPNESALIRVGMGISLSALFYFLLQYFLGRKELRPFEFELNWTDPDLHRLLKLAIPTMLSASIAQLTTMIMYTFTKGMIPGTSTALRYATTVWLLPYGVFTVGIGQAMLPTLSELVGRRKFAEAAKVLRLSMRQVLFLAVPCTLLVYFFRYELVRAIFLWGQTSAERIEVVRLSGDILGYFSLAVLGQSILFIMNFAFYSVKKTIIPLFGGVGFLITTWIFTAIFAKENVLGASGLSLAYGLSSILIGLALILYFNRAHSKMALRRMTVFCTQELILAVGMVILLFVLQRMGLWYIPKRKMVHLVWLGIRCLIAMAAYFYAADALYLPEARRFLRMKPKRRQEQSENA